MSGLGPAGDAISAYMIIRAFSWQLRLSPVAFEEFAAALFASHPSPLLDEVRSIAFSPNRLLLDETSWKKASQ